LAVLFLILCVYIARNWIAHNREVITLMDNRELSESEIKHRKKQKLRKYLKKKLFWDGYFFSYRFTIPYR